ncbi:SAM-dependent methyltransferase [Pullulanibacillus pueri]|uniref:Methyltransferase type 11 domain-containing protein n=1 Tax=Pullulanibacillus pueri TaxID=1437324 RepID=A0A8J2ZUY5_9BACL|nr:class I SAM-dependent methyltransferase [Pullulanibacillus pueri]MBM7680768.1 SAM-dependent methyltransferase [Pullulanibacillus pueri]GGH78259.1 hypothetical protein GCM10007096_11410 [Pullulanibacillus pueri]
MGETNKMMAALRDVSNALEQANSRYCLLEEAALWLQGVDVPVHSLVLAVQWDTFTYTYKAFEAFNTTAIEKEKHFDFFTFHSQQIKVEVRCYYNTVIATDPDRLAVEKQGTLFWVKSPDYYLRHLDHKDERYQAIKAYLQRVQSENSQVAKQAWTQGTYQAWLERFGPPEAVAQGLIEHPFTKLSSLGSWLGDLRGKKVINLLGSHGTKAIAMALLGATATVVDISEENARYAQEVAQAVGVDLEYIVSDVLSLPEAIFNGDYDLVLMELGILHYFVDLEPLVKVVTRLLKQGGRLILQDFHPVSTKLISSKGRKHKVTGNYFSKELIRTEVAFTKFLTDESETAYVYERQWTMGEVVTAVGQGGLFIQQLDEQPNIKINDIGLPKIFTIIAEKL